MTEPITDDFFAGLMSSALKFGAVVLTVPTMQAVEARIRRLEAQVAEAEARIETYVERLHDAHSRRD